MTLKEYPIRTLEIGDPTYPKALAVVLDQPHFIYYKGDMAQDMFLVSLSIVGSRKMTGYGESVLQHLFKELNPNITIVSGFTRGVDSLAHRLAIEHKMKTVAVLPCGIEEIYPPTNKSLYLNLLESGGVVLSEYSGKAYPQKWMFAKRNRLIGALGQALLLIEATLASGSLITDFYAQKYGRPRLAVPGDIFREMGKGVCQALKTGAKPVFSGSEINDLLGLKAVENSHQRLTSLDPPLLAVLAQIQKTPATTDELVQSLSLNTILVNEVLTKLELQGYIKEIRGVFYASLN